MADLKPFIEYLERELTCSVCLDIIRDPKTLPCLHSYCTKCIVEYCETVDNQVTNQFDCPVCKTRTEIPDGDASKFRPSFYLNSLLPLLRAMKTTTTQQELPDCVSCEKPKVLVAFCPKCNGYICMGCVDAHKAIKQVRDEHNPTMFRDFNQANVGSFVTNQLLCKSHKQHKLEYYCQEESCRKCVCQKCAILNHQNHRMQSLDEAAEDVKKAIQKDLDRVGQLKEKYEEELERSKQNIERIRNEIDLAKEEVCRAQERIFKMVADHTEAMITALDQTLHEQIEANDGEFSDIDTGIKQLSELPQQWQKLQDRGLLYEMIESKENIQQICHALLETPSILCSKPIQRNVKVRYVSNQQILQSLQDMGKIVKSVTDPSRSTIESRGEVRSGFVQSFRIVTRNTEGEVCHTGIESIDAKIKDVDGNELKMNIFEEQPGKYCVCYTAEKDGPHEIYVTIGGKPIENSPQNVNIISAEEEFKYDRTFGERGHGEGQLSSPKSIAQSENGQLIAIVDSKNVRIQIFSVDGNFLREFGRKGTAEGELCAPSGVIFNEERIIVSDRPDNKGRIQEFDLNGAYVRTIYGPDNALDPSGMCVNDNKDIAVCSQGNKEQDTWSDIKVFNKQGHLIHEFMSDNNEAPRYITYGNGKYFVSDYDKSCINVFGEDGAYLNQFVVKGRKRGKSNKIRGLAFYSPNMILVCDVDNHRVQLLTEEGQFIRAFGSLGTGVGQMNHPTDLVVTADGQVIVVEGGGRRVQIWY